MPADATAQPALRGSQKLLQGLANNGEVPSLEQINKALGLESIAGLRVPNWLIKGTPPAYLEWNATIQVPIGELNAILNRFVALNDSSINLVILINGIPAIDGATVVVSNTP
jgi:hypothetical protein